MSEFKPARMSGCLDGLDKDEAVFVPVMDHARGPDWQEQNSQGRGVPVAVVLGVLKVGRGGIQDNLAAGVVEVQHESESK